MPERADEPPFIRRRVCECRRHPIWLAIDLVAWLMLDRTVLVRRRCPIHGKCHA